MSDTRRISRRGFQSEINYKFFRSAAFQSNKFDAADAGMYVEVGTGIKTNTSARVYQIHSTIKNGSIAFFPVEFEHFDAFSLGFRMPTHSIWKLMTNRRFFSHRDHWIASFWGKSLVPQSRILIMSPDGFIVLGIHRVSWSPTDLEPCPTSDCIMCWNAHFIHQNS